MSAKREQFIKILREMFQYDYTELDFGIYRIMNQKRDEIDEFLVNQLLPQVRKVFEYLQGDERKEVEKALAATKKQLEDMGVPLEQSPEFKELKQRLEQATNVESLENEVFSNLTNFFKRYYDNGDFISQRRYKNDVYAIPYEGEEVKLHWANADQYYVKTSEYFSDYTFKLPSGKKVHFVLVEANTEQDNNKDQKGKERRFILAEEEPIEEIV